MPIVVGNRPPSSVLLPVLGAIVALAWVTLWWLEQSPYGWLFHQHGVAAHHATTPVPGWIEASLFLAGWLVMTVAMMLPTTVSLAYVFRRMVSRRGNGGLLFALLFSGYLAAWLACGVFALSVVWGVQYAAEVNGWLAGRPWLFSAGLFFVAGAFQFSALKYACLDKCRTPAGFVISLWHGARPRLESFSIGWRHGLFCVGCCWALMLLMFAVSTASLAWMLMLAIIMAVEKNVPWGRKIGRPLGVALLATGMVLMWFNVAQ